MNKTNDRGVSAELIATRQFIPLCVHMNVLRARGAQPHKSPGQYGASGNTA
jgi:hypothetical protein